MLLFMLVVVNVWRLFCRRCCSMLKLVPMSKVGVAFHVGVCFVRREKQAVR